MKLYVGNLPYETTETSVETLFAQHGTVQNINIIYDRYSGQSKGFGFVEMSSKQEGLAAIEQLNEHNYEGRNLRVNEAIDKRDSNRQFSNAY